MCQLPRCVVNHEIDVYGVGLEVKYITQHALPPHPARSDQPHAMDARCDSTTPPSSVVEAYYSLHTDDSVQVPA